MTDDLISRSALIKTFEDAKLGEDSLVETVLAAGVYTTIENAPAIDAMPVVHGRWVRAAGKSNIWYCSVCGDKINYKQNRRTYNIPKVPVEQKNKFCRNCGAKMNCD